VVVVADNCTDQTATHARAAGAVVMVRNDPERRGKGHALAHAFEASLRGDADAVVVVDADTVVSPDLLSAFQARLLAGAPAVRADYGVRNPLASWRTRLITIAFATFHVLRSQARERLRLSCGLRGNGMCFSRALLKEVPHDAFSIVEDLEYGIRLGEAGHRVHYAAEAHVYGEMVTTARAARSQRKRWEGGRFQIARAYGPRLLRRGLLRRDALLLDLAMDVLVPPLSICAGVVLLGLAASSWLALRLGTAPAPLWVWAACALALCTYVARGWQLSGTGARGLVDLMCAPAYVLWKLTVMRGDGRAKDEWVRTTREGAGN
jgi:cellulose synthase/poly-beta-1,6-N-acetylglucosamine synthase-like glycosyltransferase